MGSAGPMQPFSLNKTKLSAPQHISHICDGHSGGKLLDWIAQISIFLWQQKGLLNNSGPGPGSDSPLG